MHIGDMAGTMLGWVITRVSGFFTFVGGVLFGQAPGAGSGQGIIGLVLALIGLIGMIGPKFFEDRRHKRDHEAKLYEHQIRELQERLERAEAAAADTPSNTVKLAANEGKTDAIQDELEARGFLRARGRPHSTLLLVEDDPVTARALSRLFTAHGFSVQAAPTLAEALARLDDGFGRIVLDLGLPDGDGLDVLGEVVRREIPSRVVITTGQSQDDWSVDLPRMLRPGDRVLTKPVDFDDLLDALDGGEGREA